MEETKRCLFCDEPIRVNAIKCRYCGSMLSESLPTSASLSGIQLVKQALGSRYEILEEIGRGGMATVYKAVQKNLERTVALKVIHQNLLHDAEFVARFHREAKLCASLNHPNIVHVYDEGEVSGVHFMAMEYLEGQDLRQIIRSRGKLTPEQTLQYLLPVAEALEYAHAEGLIHRDIKSANIYITNKGRVVLMDFGIAHAAAGTQLTRAGTVIGTPEYMSPEQADGRQVDARTDLYSLGVVMYECLTGRVPFASDTAVSTIYKVINEKPDESGFNFIPKDVKALTMSLLSKNPEHRPASAAKTAQAIRLLQQGKEWQPPSQPTQQPEPERPTIKVSQAKPPDKQFEPRINHTQPKKQVSPVVWVLGVIALVLVIILVNHQKSQRQIAEQNQIKQEAIDRDNNAWQTAQNTNTIASYDRYLRDYPNGQYTSQARAKKNQLEDEQSRQNQAREADRQALQTAQNTNTIASYERYLRDYPNGQYASQASAKKNQLEDEQSRQNQARQADQQAWQTAQNTNTIASYDRYLSDYPSGQYTSQARAKKNQLEDEQSRQNQAKQADHQAWQTAQNTNTIASYERYLRDYPNGQYASQARTKKRELEEAARFSNYTETASGLNLQMVFVKGGSFTMGCTPEQGSDCYADEKPTRRVTVSDFYIGKYEVTQKQWRDVMGSDPPRLRFKGCDDCPVERVSWNDVQEFIRKLNQLTGKRYRLPTEAEWEFAARGSTQSRGFKYAGSNNIDEVAWYTSNSGSKTRPVGGKKANELGIYDMSGNVWEWCNDWYGNYSSGSQTNPQGPSSGPRRVMRGGSWNGDPRDCRVASRSYFAPGLRFINFGFRLSRMD